MIKMLIGLLMAGFLAVSQASPALQERNEFCQFLASNAGEAAKVRSAGADEESFQAALAQYAMMLYMNAVAPGVMTENQLVEILHAMEEAFAQGRPPATAAQAAYQSCMNRKEV